MRRTTLIVLAVVAVATAGLFAQAANKPAPQKPAPAAVGPNYVDANGDGICDHFAAAGGQHGLGFGRGRGAGMAGGTAGGMGRGFGRGMGAGMAGGMGRGFGRGMGGGPVAGLGFGRNGESLVDITARATGMPRVDVLSALQGGRTFAQIAEEHGKSAQDLAQAALTARQALLAQAVGEGRLTQEQADLMMGQMKLRLDQCLTAPWEPRGRGRGFQAGCPLAGTASAAPIRK